MRTYPEHEDLGLDPQADRTEDRRPGKHDCPGAGTPRQSERPTEKGSSMNTVTPQGDTSATWRDYADALSPELRRDFEATDLISDSEAQAMAPGVDPDEVRRRIRASMLKTAKAQARFARVPLPPTSTLADTWQDDSTGNWTRTVFGPRRTIDHLSIGVDGVQHPDGSVQWQMYASVDDDPLTPEQARAFAEMLVLVAADYELLTSTASDVVDTSRVW